MKYYKFRCGCQFEILEEKEPLPLLKFDFNSINMNCPAVWEMLGKGMCKGVFQLESNLGRQWCKKLKPENLEHLTALGALLRPGCLQAKDENGISTTEHYCLRKNGQEPVEIKYEPIKDVLEPTYGVMCYQEQAILIARIIAGFNLQEADELRKAMGKKLAEEMKKVEIKFLAGAKKVALISEEDAAELFDGIKKSQRYSFNKSHAYCYAINGYWSAYCKAHFPLQFFTSYLYYASDKQKPFEEIRELINETKMMEPVIEVFGPQILDFKKKFWNDGYKIHYGLADIKGIGKKQVEKIIQLDKESNIKIGYMSWYQFLILISDKLNRTTVHNMICVGALSHIKEISRTRMLDEFRAWLELNDKQRDWIRENCSKSTNIIDAMKILAPTKKMGGGCHNSRSTEKVNSLVSSLVNSPTSTEDNPAWIVGIERKLLGVPITFSMVDTCSNTADANISCKEFSAGKGGTNDTLIFAVQIVSVRHWKTKRGKNPGQTMAFLQVEDSSGSLDMTVFPSEWTSFSSLLTEMNTVIIEAQRDKKQNSCIVKNVFQM